MNSPDRSNGYEAVAPIYIAGRGSNPSGVGASVVAEWCGLLPAGTSILDLGCGCGVPISVTLLELGFRVYGVDASPTMLKAFQERLPGAPVECADVNESTLFDRQFEAAVCWGLMFLLSAEAQSKLLRKVAASLSSGGRFLFTSPRQSCSWEDAMTGQRSISLGLDVYKRTLDEAGMTLVGTYEDAGENFYYSLLKR